MKKKYVIASTVVILSLVVVVFFFFNQEEKRNANTGTDAQSIQQNQETTDLLTKIEDMKNAIAQSEETSVMQMELATRDRGPQQIVVVTQGLESGSYRHGILYQSGGKYNEKTETIDVQYKGDLVETKEPIGKVGYPFILYEKRENFTDQKEFRKAAEVKRKEFTVKLLDGAYVGELPLVDTGYDYLVYSGYLPLYTE